MNHRPSCISALDVLLLGRVADLRVISTLEDFFFAGKFSASTCFTAESGS